MKVLFVGGTGNISRACVSVCLEQGFDVGVVTRGHTFVPEVCTSFSADRYDTDAMAAAVRSYAPEIVVNFLGFDIPELAIDYQVLAGRVSQYMFISSATVYAKPHEFVPVTETHPLGNRYSDYAAKKQRCEEWLFERYREDRFPVTVIRPSHTYSERWLPNIVKSAGYTFGDRLRTGRPVFLPGDGLSRWTVTSSRDFAAGLVGLVGNSDAVGQIYHITSDDAMTWREIFESTAEALGVSTPEILEIPVDCICRAHPPLTAGLKGDKAHDGVFDNSKIKSAVPAFAAKTSFAQGIAESVRWFDEDPVRRVLDPQTDAVFDRVIENWKGERLTNRQRHAL